MSRAVITTSLLTAIANAIRAKTGKSAAMTPAQMATEIAGIPSGDVPEWLYRDPSTDGSSASYPASYTWPYAYMRPYQLARWTRMYAATPFYQTFDFGTLTQVPDDAMSITPTARNSPNFGSNDKLQHVSGTGITNIGQYAFNNCAQLLTANFPALRTVGQWAFGYCKRLETVSMPMIENVGTNAFSQCTALRLSGELSHLTDIGQSGFYTCSSLGDFVAPALTTAGMYALAQSGVTKIVTTVLSSIGNYMCQNSKQLTTVELGGTYTTMPQSAFAGCSALTTADLASQSLTRIEANAFASCTALTTVIIRRTTGVVTLAAGTAFNNTPLASGTGCIYVPDDLLDQYKTNTNWSTFAARFKGISEYVEEDPT